MSRGLDEMTYEQLTIRSRPKGCHSLSTLSQLHDSSDTPLRKRPAAMDRAVLEGYGWHDLVQTARCEFLLDYEEDGDQVSGCGDESDNHDEADPDTDDEIDSPKPKKAAKKAAAKPRVARKSKNNPATGQQEMDF